VMNVNGYFTIQHDQDQPELIEISSNLGKSTKETKMAHRDDLHGSPSLVPIQIPPLLSPFCGEPAPRPIDQPERDGGMEREIVVYPEKRQIERREGHGERVGVDQPSRLSMVTGLF
jgi:hypothetical protein